MKLSEYIKSGNILLLDGGMGTQIEKRGGIPGGQSCITNPDIVFAIHKDYVDAGAGAIITNTLTMNRVYIETHGLDVDVRKVNLEGAALARKAAGSSVYVLGDISSTAQMLEPYGDYTEEQFYEAYREQAEALAEGGVDGFIIETMFDLNEALCALRACRDADDIPVIASMTFSTVKNGGRTIMGNSAADCAKQLEEAGAWVVGTNCGDLDPDEIAEVAGIIKGSSKLPITAQPNAGKPQLIDGKTVFCLEPEAFTKGIMKCIDNGATIVGGCCGTTPAHIKAVYDALKAAGK